jgi:choline dehydrogenase-like flavoprotein
MAAPNLPALCSLEDFLKHYYDFIIVGGGTADLTVAARLSENPKWQVGVLEAGAANIGDPMIVVPALCFQTPGNPQYDWAHKTTPQVSSSSQCSFQALIECLQQVHSSGKALGFPRGKGLGGSSAINFETYARAQTADYDDWARLGNKGWDFKGLLSYFKKHEHFDGPAEESQFQDKYELAFHGHDGPIHTALPTWRPAQEKAWMETCGKIGKRMGSPKDAWSGDHLGTYSSLATIDRSPGPFNGTRSYATTGYLIPNAGRPNLHVLTEALVLKLSLSQDCSVSGVEFQHSGNIHKVSVKKEVILSAGTIKSPQVLELSGIGDPDILSKAGIECLVENKRVGENFQDHPLTGVVYELAPGELSMDMLQDEQEVQKAMAEYGATRTDVLASSGSGNCFVSYAALSSHLMYQFNIRKQQKDS